MNSLIQSIPVPLQSALLLVLSNVFMTFAWYGHLKNMVSRGGVFHVPRLNLGFHLAKEVLLIDVTG